MVGTAKPLEVSFKTSEIASGFRPLPSFETVELVATALPGSLAAREYGRDYICRVGLERALPPTFDHSPVPMRSCLGPELWSAAIENARGRKLPQCDQDRLDGLEGGRIVDRVLYGRF